MHFIDYAIIAGYMLAMLGVGVYYMRRQEGTDAYFVGNRNVSTGHLGLSVVATDVGGGFSIGLGGLGFAIGLSGSWLLLSGLIGAWVTAVLVIPRVKPLGDKLGWTTFPDLLAYRFDERTRKVAGVVSGLGYASFVGAQVLAGATLVEGALDVDKTVAVIVMAFVIVSYTSIGGLQAVIITDTIQWIVLLVGLLVFALPFAIDRAGGFSELVAAMPEGHLSMTNVSAGTLVKWAVTIIPIWFVGNTLYQRIYAARDEKSARRAWYLAGLLEWPLMAFVGAGLGAIARVLFPELGIEDRELALPLLIRDVLPIGVVGIVLAAYFSAIMSTADSCLLASVGHLMGDLIPRKRDQADSKGRLRLSRIATVTVGAISVGVALLAPTVLDAILLTYSFMVSGLFVPAFAALFWRRATARAALASMLLGGGTAVVLQIPAFEDDVSGILGSFDPSLAAMAVATLVMICVSLTSPPPAHSDGLFASERGS